jgi:hypothetical protein
MANATDDPSTTPRDQLMGHLRTNPRDPTIPALIAQVESESAVDLREQASLLTGVWELRWSSSSQPWLKQAPWLENLQLLDPARGQGMNLLRLSGPFGALAAVAVQAELTIEGSHRVGVRFQRGGWIGPSLPGGWRPELLATVKQPFPAWLEITALDHQLRLCKGNAGTYFALLRRDDLSLDALMPAPAQDA